MLGGITLYEEEEEEEESFVLFCFDFIFGEGFFVSNNHLREEAGGKRSVSS